MKNLLSSNYFLFGTHYYKAPSPDKNDWEKDLKNIAELGFNTVRFSIQWRWHHPQADKVQLADIDQLMQLAQQNNLHVILNIIADTAPGWIYKKYPDAPMVTLSGKKIDPQTAPNRQIGGLGYCFNNDYVMKHFLQFLMVTVDRYKAHPALEIWDVGSQPELTGSLAGLREYANDPGRIGDMACYCDICKAKFKKWLEFKYKDIQKLNACWNRNYISFDEIEMPVSRNTYNDIIDWRMFFVFTLGKNIEKRIEVAKKADAGKHPVMCHHASIMDVPVTSTANDPWNIGRLGDLHGSVVMGDAGNIDILRSSAKNKPVIASEFILQKGYTLEIPDSKSAIDIKKAVFTALAGNLKGLVFRQYRPEILGREAPAWGLTSLEGKPTERLDLIAKVGQVLNKNAEFLLNAKAKQASVAIMYNPENQIFAWASAGKESLATQSILGIHRALYDRNYNVDFIHPQECTQEVLAGYKVLIIPFPYVIGERIATVISSWVNNGGLLISEAFTAGWDIDRGQHAKVIPGSGLDKVYQATQGVVRPVDSNEGTEVTTYEKNIFGENLKLKGFFVQEELIADGADAGNKTGADNRSEVDNKMDANIQLDADSGTEDETGTKINGRYKNHEAAVTIAEYGKGKAILIGTYIGIVCFKENHLQNSNYIAKLIDSHSDVKVPVIDFGKTVRVDVLQSDNNQTMIIVRNQSGEALESGVNLNIKIADELKEQFSDEKVKVKRTEEGVKVPFYLEPYQIKVYFG